MAEQDGIDINITSETQQIKDSSTAGHIKRLASQAASKIGLGKLAQNLNPDTEITFVDSIDPEEIKIVDPTSVTPEDILIETQPVANEEEFSIDLEPQGTRRIVKEIPRNTAVVGIVDTRPNFERTFVEDETLREITTYLRSDPRREMGGILVGQFCEDSTTGRAFTLIQSFIAKTGSHQAAAIEFAPEDWADMLRRLDELNNQTSQNLSVVGWIHSHPPNAEVAPQSNSSSQNPSGYGDRRIMRDHFPDSKYLALIYGMGGRFDNQYAIWRNMEGKALRQTGFEITQPKGDTQFQYYSNLSEL